VNNTKHMHHITTLHQQTVNAYNNDDIYHVRIFNHDSYDMHIHTRRVYNQMIIIINGEVVASVMIS
jgi:hypothetical protein